MRRKALLLFLLPSIFVSTQQSVPAQSLTPLWTTYLSNSGEPLGGSALYGSDAWIAQSLETGTAPDGYLLNGPILFSGFGAPTTELSFYSDDNGVPGVELGGPGIIFSPSTIYWFVATASEPSESSGPVQVFPKSWNYASDSNYSSSDNWSLLPAFATSGDVQSGMTPGF